MRTRWIVVAAVTLLVAACNPDPTTGTPPEPGAEGVPAFAATVVAVGPGTAYPLEHSWRDGCPKHYSELVAIEFPHWGYDGEVHDGVLIVNAHQARGVRLVLERLYVERFQIEQARPVDDFGGSDEASMAANNTSAFNCRTVAGTDTWSEHAYGRSIDVNPIQNPYVKGSFVDPAAGKDWLDRGHVVPGMAAEGTVIVEAFDDIGWGWGGRWNSVKDYQHFSASGR